MGSYDNYRQLAEAANEKMLAALDKLGLKGPYLSLMSKSKLLLVDQFSDIVQRPEYQQIYVIGNEIYQQVRIGQQVRIKEDVYFENEKCVSTLIWGKVSYTELYPVLGTKI